MRKEIVQTIMRMSKHMLSLTLVGDDCSLHPTEAIHIKYTWFYSKARHTRWHFYMHEKHSLETTDTV